MKVMKVGVPVGSAIVGMVFLAGVGLHAGEMVALPQTPTVLVTANNFVACKNPRPEICYEVYAPVCAVRETKMRCIVAPCAATEQISYPNDCNACADPQVIGFASGGECP